MRRLIPYVRVSTDEQYEKGNSIPHQTEQCLTYIAMAGAEATETVTDDFTGTKLDRPGLRKVRDMLADGEADGIVVYRSDRLTRSLAHSVILREEFSRMGKEVHFCNHGQYDDSPEGRMIIDIEAVFNQYWRDKLVQDTTNGRRQKARSGHHPGTGLIPYGYRYDQGLQNLVIFEEEAVIVRRIYDWYIMDRMNIADISRRLTEQGVPPPHGGARHVLFRRDIFLTDSVRNILASEIYAGVWSYAGVAVPVPVIVSREVWDEAAKLRSRNKELATRNQKSAFLLAGLIRCGIHKRKFHGLSGGRVNNGRPRITVQTYYACASRIKEVHTPLEVCSIKRLRAPWLEAEVWGGVYALIKDDTTWEEGIRQAVEHMDAIRKPAYERLEMVDHLITGNVAEAQQLVDSLKEAKKGKPVHDALNRRIDQLEQVYDTLVHEREGLLEALARTISAEDIERARRAREYAARGIENATWEDKRRILEMMETQVTVYPERVVVQCNMSIPAFEIPIDVASSCRSPFNLSFEIWLTQSKS